MKKEVYKLKVNLCNNLCISFGLLFSKSISLLFLQLPERIVLDPNGPYKNERKNFVILSVVVVCSSLFIGSQFLLKIQYFNQGLILTKLPFWFSRPFFGQDANTALYLKKISQKWTAFAFSNTYFHQTLILKY